MKDLQSSQPIDKKTYLWSTIAGIIGFIQINFFIVPQIRPSGLEIIGIAVFLNLLNGIVFIFYKFSKKWKVIVGSIFLIAIVFVFSELSIVPSSVNLEIEPKKNLYKLGETITAKTTVSNYAIIPSSVELYSVVPQIFLYQIAPEVWFNYNSEQPFQYPSRLEKPEKLYLMPFQTKTYETKLTLINNKTSFDDSGTSDNHDIMVQPGENTIQALFSVFDGDDIKINVDSQNFNQAIIPCENFTDEKRQQSCQKTRSD